MEQCKSIRFTGKDFGGSGYDIACAGAETPILFQRKNETPQWEKTIWDFSEKEKLFFIHLGKKKNSREAITHYREEKSNQGFINNMSNLTDEFLQVKNIKSLNAIIREHENLLSQRLKIPTVKQERFSDFTGEVKSLGGWGGDFILATCTTDESKFKKYFKSKGLGTILAYNEMAL